MALLMREKVQREKAQTERENGGKGEGENENFGGDGNFEGFFNRDDGVKNVFLIIIFFD